MHVFVYIFSFPPPFFFLFSFLFLCLAAWFVLMVSLRMRLLRTLISFFYCLVFICVAFIFPHFLLNSFLATNLFSSYLYFYNIVSKQNFRYFFLFFFPSRTNKLEFTFNTHGIEKTRPACLNVHSKIPTLNFI